MSGIMKFWIVSGILFWAGILGCLGILASQRIFETIARRRFRRRWPEGEVRWERCTLCEGERWLWQRTEGPKSSARERVPCPDCHGTGRTEVKK